MIKNYKIWSWVVTIPVAFVVWFFGTAIIHHESPTSGSFDIGIFEVPMMVLVFSLIIKALSILFIKLFSPSLFDYYTNKEGSPRVDLKELTPKQRICVLLLVFFLFYFSFVYLSGLILGGGSMPPLPVK